VLDTACARLAIGQNAVPAALEDARRRLTGLDLEIGTLEREQITSPTHSDRLKELRETRETARQKVAEIEARWERERGVIEQIRALRDQLEAKLTTAVVEQVEVAAAGAPARAVSQAGDGDNREALRADLGRLNDELADLQGENPLMQVVVDAQTVGEVIAGWTGIPVGKMKGDEIQTVLSLEQRLQQRVLGQAHALGMVSERIRISRARLEDPRKPIGVFMLVGPSGVGKTETALALADTLYGGEHNLITINMSEYQEAHTVSSLKGSPPGYVGYGEGGVLTEAVRRKPYSVVLLDEVEKAHSDVLELFFQVFDKGMLEDGEGREIDFKNTVILLTSNVGTDTIMKVCADEETRPAPEGLADLLRGDLLKRFPPAFLGRLMVIPYYPIADAVMRQIIELQLRRLQARIQAHHRAQLTYAGELVDAIKSRCTEVDSGARNVEHILTRTLLPEISREVLARMAVDEQISSVHITAEAGGAFRFDVR
jgi:type VI secretion system protein VasG